MHSLKRKLFQHYFKNSCFVNDKSLSRRKAVNTVLILKTQSMTQYLHSVIYSFSKVSHHKIWTGKSHLHIICQTMINCNYEYLLTIINTTNYWPIKQKSKQNDCLHRLMKNITLTPHCQMKFLLKDGVLCLWCQPHNCLST
jgi:hypothetical protein